jgi:hypothetical protein
MVCVSGKCGVVDSSLRKIRSVLMALSLTASHPITNHLRHFADEQGISSSEGAKLM